MRFTLKNVHFSIDDIGKSMIWLATYNPPSIFDMRLYGTLKRWHDLYDLNVTLYCYAKIRDFSFDQIPEKYKYEFEKNKWLRFGYHGRVDTPMKDNDDYVQEHKLFLETAKRLGMATTDIYRLDYWIPTLDQKRYFMDNGVRVLLYPDDDNYPYDANDEFEEDGLLFWRTNIRFDIIENIDSLKRYMSKDRLVVFAHEWAFDKQMTNIEQAIQLFKRLDYRFI